MSILSQDKEMRRKRLGIRVTYGVALAFFPTAVIILALRLETSFIILSPTALAHRLNAEVILIGCSILFIALGFFWPWLARWRKKAYVDDMELIYGHLIRDTLITTPVIYGILLRAWGSGWYIVLPIYILAFAALVVTFPTDKRLAEWQQGQKPSS